MAIDVYKEWLGIPEEFRPPDHYQLLRLIQFEDDSEKIRAHYKKLNAHVRKYATGQYSDESQELLNELAKAMLCLTDPPRKREYDEGEGRDFSDEEELGERTVGDILVARQVISREQMQEATEFADQRGLSMRDAVVQMKLVDGETATKALAEELGLSYVDLDDITPDDDVLDEVSRNLVKRNSILPLFIDDDVLLVACADEPAHELEDELRMLYGVPMRRVIATNRQITHGIAKYFADGMRNQEPAEEEEVAGDEGKTKKAAKKPAKKSKKAAAKKAAPLTPEEKKERQQMGYVIIMMSVFAAFLVSQFIPFFSMATNPLVSYSPLVIAAGASSFYVFQIYLKQ